MNALTHFPAAHPVVATRAVAIRPATVAIVGATGAVGIELIKCLGASTVPTVRLRLFASRRSAGKCLPFRGSMVVVESLDEASFEGVDIAFFSAGATISRRYAPHRSGRRGAGHRQLFRVSDGPRYPA